MSDNIKRTQKETLLKVWNYIKKYRLLVCCSILFAGVVVALTLYLPILVGEAIDYIVEPGKIEFATIKDILIKTVMKSHQIRRFIQPLSAEDMICVLGKNLWKKYK